MLPITFPVNREKEENRSECELMKRVALRDEQALSEIYDVYSGALYSIIFNIVKCEEEAKDILQHVLLLVWQKAVSFDADKGNLFTWLVTLARNKALDKLRSKEYRIKQLTTSYINENKFFDYSGSTPLDIIIAGERAHYIAEALAKITPEQKKILELIYFEGYTQSEAAQTLRIPLGTVKTRVRQAINKLYSLTKNRKDTL